MPLLLLDLDNTLIDRDGAFLGWADAFLGAHRLPQSELAWLATIDGGGYVPRETVFRAAHARYRLPGPVEERVAEWGEEYRAAMVRLVHCPEANREALRAARRAGWTLGIVTNGLTEHQWQKIEAVGLADLVDGCVVSEEAGREKPDPEIFRLAAQRCGVTTGAPGGASPGDAGAWSGPAAGADGAHDAGGARDAGGLPTAFPSAREPGRAAARLAAQPSVPPGPGWDHRPARGSAGPVAAAEAWTAETWMVGDHASADIAGADVAGLRSVWLHHGRPWPYLHYRPTLTASDLPEAVARVLASAPAAASHPEEAPAAPRALAHCPRR